MLNMDQLFPPRNNNLSLYKNQYRWRFARLVIFCSRAFLRASKHNCRQDPQRLPPSSSSLVVDLNSTQNLSFGIDQATLQLAPLGEIQLAANVDQLLNSSFGIDRATLTAIVKERNGPLLRKCGHVDGIASALGTNIETGIRGDDDDITRRREAFDTNTYEIPPPEGFLCLAWESFNDLTILILMVCAALSLGFGIVLEKRWYDVCGCILVAVFLAILVDSIGRYRERKKLDKLSQVNNKILSKVLRSGRRKQISTTEIVVGDVVCLKIGDQVPADGLFLHGHSLRVDESNLTGESDHVEVNKIKHPYLFAGTHVTDGSAKMVVTSVGMNTTWGQIMSSTRHNTNQKSPLQSGLDKLTASIGKVGLLLAFVVLAVLMVRYFTGNTRDENGNREFNGKNTKSHDIWNAVAGIVVKVVIIVAVAIPEGLPLAVKLTLAYSMREMMAYQVMVRKPFACETMDSVTIICTDMRGTLTLNQMKVTKSCLGQQSVEEPRDLQIDPHVLNLIREGVALNTTGGVDRDESNGGGYEFTGSPTEKAILEWAVEILKMDMKQQTQDCEILHVQAFNSEKKKSGVLIRRKGDNTIQVHWKGAAEMILERCSSYYDASGFVKDLNNDEARSAFERIIEGMAASSLRCIAFATKQENQDEEENRQVAEDGLTLIGIVGIKDPCRPGVKQYVEACRHAGINVKMITGDNVFTAKAIATDCGILQAGQDPNRAVVKGEDFSNYRPEERLAKVDEICVMARSSPFDKILMVQCLKEKGHVVAVTGHDISDVPALKEAHVGLSMGIQGTEAAKESSGIVILDDSFFSVVEALKWGRCVCNNIRRITQFRLTAKFAALAICSITVFAAGKVPLTVFQLLWVSLVTTLGAWALATEKPTKSFMHQQSNGRTEPLIITKEMWWRILAQFLYQLGVSIFLQFMGKSRFRVSSEVNDTLIFTIFVLGQVTHLFNAWKMGKTKREAFREMPKNKLFLGIIGIIIVAQVVMVEFLNKLAGTEKLNWKLWGWCIGIAIGNTVVLEALVQPLLTNGSN